VWNKDLFCQGIIFLRSKKLTPLFIMGGLSRHKCVEKEQCAMAQISDIPLQLWATLSRQFQMLFIGILKNILTAHDIKPNPCGLLQRNLTRVFVDWSRVSFM